jgi:antitoxin component YwqK of YwqJK toxin-antitoxin module
VRRQPLQPPGQGAREFQRRGRFAGWWTWWRPDGELLQEGTFEAGLQVGPWKRYFADRTLWDEGEYSAAGRRVGERWTFDRSDALAKTQRHRG